MPSANSHQAGKWGSQQSEWAQCFSQCPAWQRFGAEATRSSQSYKRHTLVGTSRLDQARK
eukprot:6194892-Amphidinium_carterae.1